MKHFFYAITCTLSIVASTLPVQAIEANATHLHSSVVLPRNARIPNATYRIRLHVTGSPLTQLGIQLPERIRVSKGIEVTDQAGNEVSTTGTLSRKTAPVAFTQPVSPGTILKIDLKGIRTPDLLGHTWLLPLSGRSAGMTADIPFGTARIQTSK